MAPGQRTVAPGGTTLTGRSAVAPELTATRIVAVPAARPRATKVTGLPATFVTLDGTETIDGSDDDTLRLVSLPKYENQTFACPPGVR